MKKPKQTVRSLATELRQTKAALIRALDDKRRAEGDAFGARLDRDTANTSRERLVAIAKREAEDRDLAIRAQLESCLRLDVPKKDNELRAPRDWPAIFFAIGQATRLL